MTSSVVETKINRDSPDFEKNTRRMVDLLTEIKNQETEIQQGGGAKAIESQHKKGRLTASERIAKLIDPQTSFFELGIYAAHEMYEEWGGAPAAGIITGLATDLRPAGDDHRERRHGEGRSVFPSHGKESDPRAKYFHRQSYSHDLSGRFRGRVFPLQEDVFPDTDDFGRVFRNNAVMSAMGIPQITAIMGMCVAGGAYLPVMCDKILMTEGSGLFLAGPALVQAAIGQKVSAEELGGAKMHAEISGTVDFREPDDDSCLARIRALVDKMGHPPRRPIRLQGIGKSRLSARGNLRNIFVRSGPAI